MHFCPIETTSECTVPIGVPCFIYVSSSGFVSICFLAQMNHLTFWKVFVCFKRFFDEKWSSLSCRLFLVDCVITQADMYHNQGRVPVPISLTKIDNLSPFSRRNFFSLICKFWWHGHVLTYLSAVFGLYQSLYPHFAFCILLTDENYSLTGNSVNQQVGFSTSR